MHLESCLAIQPRLMYRNVIYHRNWNGTAVVILFHAFLPDRLRLFHLDTILSTDLNWFQHCISQFFRPLLVLYVPKSDCNNSLGLQKGPGSAHQPEGVLRDTPTPRHPPCRMHQRICSISLWLFRMFPRIFRDFDFSMVCAPPCGDFEPKGVGCQSPKAKLEMPTAMPSQWRNLQLFWEIV